MNLKQQAAYFLRPVLAALAQPINIASAKT
jgi:hypothetical protein